ncbi:MarR family transcriptional regulator [Kineobactrum sediminis]|uniref:MarR family transcriptional regulator n=1 Tax=Kineobactrum sediminis TaxID=1905677 RepID=A0A2N5Y747_9GAMM|nr:MarR family transcriptional regulator [Kineobactrum sediminis]PLW84206.1 MarR family transcriptional regulator [Kineobactrum sediminis]
MSSATDIADQLSFELHSSARLWRRNFDRRAKEHGLSRARWQLLWLLAREEGLKQAELADRMDIAPISLARQVDKLELEGLVQRRRDSDDRRCFRIHLTDAAQPALQILRRLAQETRSEALAGFNTEDIAQLQQLLGRIRLNLSSEE